MLVLGNSTTAVYAALLVIDMYSFVYRCISTLSLSLYIYIYTHKTIYIHTYTYTVCFIYSDSAICKASILTNTYNRLVNCWSYSSHQLEHRIGRSDIVLLLYITL